MATKTMTLDTPARGAAKYEAAIGSMIEEIDRILKENRRKDAAIEKNQRRIRAKLDALNELTK
jgi:hypothetical protein